MIKYIYKFILSLILVFFSKNATSSGLFQSILVDINNSSSFPTLNDLTICSKQQDTLAIAIASLEDTVFLQNLQLNTTLPTGINFSGLGIVYRLNLDTLAAHPGASPTSYMTFDHNIAFPINATNYTHNFPSNLNQREVFIVYIGVRATCFVNTSGILLYPNYNLSYERYPCNTCLSPVTGHWTPTIGSYNVDSTNNPLNNFVHRPAIIVQPSPTLPTVHIGQTTHRLVHIVQTGQLAYLDSIFYQDIAASTMQIVQNSVKVNNINVPPNGFTSFGPTGMSFPIKASIYDLDGLFKEQDSIIVEYDIIANCPVGSNTSVVSASWGCVPTTNNTYCQISSANFSFSTDLGVTPNLTIVDVATPYSCATDTGMFIYNITNSSGFNTGLDSNGNFENLELRFDTRNCGLLNYNTFYIEYNGIKVPIIPNSTIGSVKIFNISAALFALYPTGGGKLPILGATNNFKFFALYNSSCTTSCTINCNTCIKPYIDVKYKDKCAVQYIKRSNIIGTQDMKNLGLLPCYTMNLSLQDYTKVGTCDRGYLDYKVDISQMDTVGGFKFSLNTFNCGTYTISGVTVNGVSVPFTIISGIANVDLRTNTIAIPNFINDGGIYSRTAIDSVKVKFQTTFVSNGLGCSFPTFKVDAFNFCKSSVNTQTLQFSGFDPNFKYNLKNYSSWVTSYISDYLPFGLCTPGYIKYTTKNVQIDTVGNLSICLDTKNCGLYGIDSIQINGVSIPGILITTTGSVVCMNLNNVNSPLGVALGFVDGDGDSFFDEEPDSISVKYFTSIRTTQLNATQQCSYPDYKVVYDICTAYRDSISLLNSGIPIGQKISLTAVPKVSLTYNTSASSLNNNTNSTINICADNILAYDISNTQTGTIRDANIYIDKGNCGLYLIDSSRVFINNVLIPATQIINLGNGMHVIKIKDNNITPIPGFADTDFDGFIDDMISDVQLKLYNIPNTVGGACCFYPKVGIAYNQCVAFRDSVTIPYGGAFPFSQVCTPYSRPGTLLTYQGYTSSSSCTADYIKYRVALATGSNTDTLSEMKFILDTRGCGIYSVDSIIINGVRLGGSSLIQLSSSVYTVNMNNNTTPITNMIDGLDVDGNIDAVKDTLNVSWQINRNGLITNTCLYPTFKIGYNLCGSGQFIDSLRYSGQTASAHINQPNPSSTNISINDYIYTPAS